MQYVINGDQRECIGQIFYTYNAAGTVTEEKVCNADGELEQMVKYIYTEVNQ